MPKQIKLLGDVQDLSGANAPILVVGANARRQSELGADWINKRLAEIVNAAPLPIVAAGEIPAEKTAVIIGTIEDNPLIARAVRDKLVGVGKNNPAARGYEIRRSADGRRIYLAGADNIGALYACVTFGELLEVKSGNAVWRAAEVRDWPDCLSVRLGNDHVGGGAMPEFHNLAGENADDPAEQRKYLASLQAQHERFLRWKISEREYPFAWKNSGNLTPAARAVLRAGIAHGAERGIAATAKYEWPYVGPVSLTNRHPEAPPVTVKAGMFDSWAPEWDDTRRETARKVAEYYQDMGFAEIKFHDTDRGSYENPALWHNRCASARRRWGDDYAAATAHKYMIYHDALREFCPGIKIHFTQYPYTLAILDERFRSHVNQRNQRNLDGGIYESTLRFWRGLADMLTADVNLTMREAYPSQVQAFRAIWPHGILTWFGIGHRSWEAFFNETPSYCRDYFRDARDKIMPRPWAPEYFVPLMGLAVREYTWNVNAPGACSPEFTTAHYLNQGVYAMPEFAGDRRKTHAIYTVILPRIVRNIFGRAAAPEITRALTHNIAPNQVFGILHYRGTTPSLADARSMAAQAKLAEDAAQNLDRVWARMQGDCARLGMVDYAFRRFVYLREAFHATHWMARVKSLDMLALELARAGDGARAQQALDDAETAFSDARNALARILAERPADPVLAATGRRWRDLWRAYMVDDGTVTAGMAAMRDKLAATRGKLEDVDLVPRELMNNLLANRVVHFTACRPEGTSGVPCPPSVWPGVPPLETLVVDGGTRVARSFTRARFARDAGSLYIRIESRTASTTPEHGEAVKVWIKTPGSEESLFMLSCDVAGGHDLKRHNLVSGRDTLVEAAEYACLVQTNAKIWRVYANIPWRVLGGRSETNGWLCGVGRAAVQPDGSFEKSWSGSRNAAAVKHDLGWMHPVVWSEPDTYRPEVVLEISKFQLATCTLPDRIASVATFSVDLNSDLVLTNPRLTVELRDVHGGLQWRDVLWDEKLVYYVRHQSIDLHRAEFREDVKDGELRLVLEADEGISETRMCLSGGVLAPPMRNPVALRVSDVRNRCADSRGSED